MFVYILRSKKTNKFYCGQTNNLADRLSRHNRGTEKYTKSGIPWEFVHVFDLKSRSDAVRLEKKIKKRGIERFLNDNDIIVEE
jgi:putative endonuclease